MQGLLSNVYQIIGDVAFCFQKETNNMKKQGITIIAGNETYENLATFKTVDELNKTVRAYKEKICRSVK